MHAYEVHTCEMHVYEAHTHEMHACEVHAHEVHAHEVYVHEVHAREVYAHEGFCEDLARQNTVAYLSQLQLGFRRCRTWVSVLSHMGFRVVAYGFWSSSWCPKDHYLGHRTVCLGTSAHRPCFDLSVCLQPVCLSPDSQSDCLRFFSPPHPPLVDSLDSKLWYHLGCRAAALASAAPRPLGSLFGSFSPRGARLVTSSLTAESPTIRSF
jgi:hypothetical protein